MHKTLYLKEICQLG